MNVEKNDETLMTAGQLARRLERSSYGVKKALQRMNITPELTLNRVSFYPASTLETLEAAMRSPNRQTA